jgi:hypothetical protein
MYTQPKRQSSAAAHRPERWRCTSCGFKRSAQQLLHLFSWGCPSERLSGAAVELGGDLVEFDLAASGQVGVLGQVLAQ